MAAALTNRRRMAIIGLKAKPPDWRGVSKSKVATLQTMWDDCIKSKSNRQSQIGVQRLPS